MLYLQGGDDIHHVRTYAEIVTVPDPEILMVSPLFIGLSLTMADPGFPVGGAPTSKAVYTTRLLARGDLILAADQLISNLLTRIGDLKCKKIQICMYSGRIRSG